MRANAFYRRVVIVQSTSGDFSPNLANINKLTYVVNQGIPPDLLEAKMKEVVQQQLTAGYPSPTAPHAELLTVATTLATSVVQLREILESVSDQSLGPVRKFLSEGNLGRAHAELDSLINRNRGSLASYHHSRALILELEFKPMEALTDFEAAYDLAPDEHPYGENYANALARQHRFKEALWPLQHTLERLRNTANHSNPLLPEMARVLRSIGSVRRSLSQHQQADIALTEALAITEKLNSSEPFRYGQELASILFELGRVHRDFAGNDSASLLERAANLLKDSPFQDSKSLSLLGSTLNSLGVTYEDLSRSGDAEATFLEAIELQRKIVSEYPLIYSVDLARTLNNYGTFLKNCHRFEDAIPFFVEAVEIRRSILDEKHGFIEPGLASLLHNYANLLRDMKRYEEAEQQYNECESIYSQLAEDNSEVFGKKHATVLMNFSQLMFMRGELTQTKSMLSKSLAIFESLNVQEPERTQILSKIHMSMANACMQTAALETAHEEFGKAEALLRIAIGNGSSSSAPVLAMALHNKGMLLDRMGDQNAAQAAWIESFWLRRPYAILAPGMHMKNTLQTIQLLISELRQKGEFTAASNWEAEAHSLCRVADERAERNGQ